ncbi:hypothetical protein [Candidatus Poriferisodalis sp.]|uniref:hypothetical protein n=1 Tax=Candidatus Poriferisodalis sp. TaxID=3101277 RepID=UPI003B52F19E
MARRDRSDQVDRPAEREYRHGKAPANPPPPPKAVDSVPWVPSSKDSEKAD